MNVPGADGALAAAIEAVARDAAPGLLNEALDEALDEARSEVKEMLRCRLVDALLAETLCPLSAPEVARSAVPPPSALSQGQPPRVSSQQGASRRGVYLYGFTFAGAQNLVGLEGFDGSPVYAISVGGVAAVVSDVSARQHGWGMGADGEPDLEQLAPRLQQHERVLEAVLERTSVVPMRFGIFYSSPQALRKVLGANAATVARVLRALEGKVEWGLTVTWDVRRARPLTTDSREPAPVGGTGRHSPGRAYLSRREAEIAESERLKEQRLHLSTDLHRAIDRVARASVVHPATQRREDPEGAEIVLRASYLVDKAQREIFEAAIVEGLEAGAELGLSGELTGPWPPYNFSTVELEQVSA